MIRRRRFAIDAPRWALIGLLGFAGMTKVFAFVTGLPVISISGVTERVESGLSALVWISALVEVGLAIALSWLLAPRRLLVWVMRLAIGWILVLVAIQVSPVNVVNCGCLGPTIRLHVADHILLSAGVILLCISQARRLSWRPGLLFETNSSTSSSAREA